MKPAGRCRLNSCKQCGIFSPSLSAFANPFPNPPNANHAVSACQDCEASSSGADQRQEFVGVAFTAPNNAELGVGGEADEQLFVTYFFTPF